MITFMSENLIDRLVAMASRTASHDAEEMLFRQDAAVRSIFVIAEGEFRLVRHLPNGLAYTLHRAREGSVLAEASLFSNRYHCDGISTGKGRTAIVAKPAVLETMRADSAFAMEWASFLAHEVQATRFRAETLALRTVAERLDSWLAVNDGSLPPRGEWRLIAGEIAVSPEALYRELARRRVEAH